MVRAVGQGATVLLGNGEAEESQPGDAGDDVGRDVAVLAMDLLGAGRDPPGREVAQGGPEEAVLLAGSDVVGRATGEEEAGDPLVGRVEGLGRAVGCRPLRDRAGELVAGSGRPLAGSAGGSRPRRGPGRLVGLYLAGDAGLQGRAVMPKASPRSTITAAIFRDASSIISSPSMTAPVWSTSVASR